jgi:hypothetical protein
MCQCWVVNPLPATRKPFFCYQRAMLLKKAMHGTPAIPGKGQTMQEAAFQRMIRSVRDVMALAPVISYREP